MRSHHRSKSSPRPAFTLVEMVVVIAIILAVAALAVLIVPRLQDSQRVNKGGDTVQGALFLAKNMALRDQQPRGIRLNVTQDPNNANNFYAYSLQLIEQPAALYLPGSALYSVVMVDDNGVVNANGKPRLGLFAYTNTAPSWTAVDFYGGYGPGNAALWPVQPGDYLDLLGNNKPDGLYLIVSVNASTTNPGVSDSLTLLSTLPQVNLQQGQLQQPPAPTQPLQWPISSYALNPAVAPSVNPTQPTPLPYRIVRGPRPMVGQQPINLPTDVAVDLSIDPQTKLLTKSIINPEVVSNPLTNTTTFVNFDVMFDPSGKVLRTAGIAGKVILWVRDPTGTDTGEETLVTVYTRTGVISAHPVNVNGDPYAFVKDGRSSGM